MLEKRSELKILSLSFYRAYDESYCCQALEEISLKNYSKYDFLGEGTHFKSFRLKEKGGSLVINLLKEKKEEFFFKEVKKWRAALEKLHKIEVPLIPPYEIITVEKNLGIVLPFGAEKPTTNYGDNTFLEKRIDETLKLLSKSALELNDQVQIKYFESIPFISDLSDLRIILT